MKLKIQEGEFEKRVLTTHRYMRERSLKALLIFSSFLEKEGNVCYLTNYRMGLIGWSGISTVLLPLDEQPILFTGGFGYCKETIVGVEKVYDKDILEDPGVVIDTMRLEKLDKARIGIVGSRIMPVGLYRVLKQALPDVKFELTDMILEEQRMIKSNNEIRILRACAKIADEGLKAAMEAIKPGAREIDVGLAAINTCMAFGAELVPRPQIKSMKRQPEGALWPPTSLRRLKEGELVGFDLSPGWYSNYCFDATRWRVVGNATPRQRTLIERASELTDLLIEALKPGMTAGELAQVAFRYGVKIGYKVRPTGHGIGLELHEKPHIRKDSNDILKPNMVLCIEPIIIDPEVGSVRIEEMVRVTETGAEIMTKCPRIF